MANSGIELRWGKGFEMSHERTHMRPLLDTARDFTQDGLADVGLGLTDRKRITIHHLTQIGAIADATTPKRINVYLRPWLMKPTEQNSFRLSAIFFHEILHCLRMERMPLGPSREYAATEGLAYVADQEFSDSLYNMFNVRRYGAGLVGRVAMISERNRKQYRSDFLRATKPCKGMNDEVHQASVDEWINTLVPNFWIGKGVVVGIDAVSKQRKAGQEFADLIYQSADEVLAA